MAILDPKGNDFIEDYKRKMGKELGEDYYALVHLVLELKALMELWHNLFGEKNSTLRLKCPFTWRLLRDAVLDRMILLAVTLLHPKGAVNENQEVSLQTFLDKCLFRSERIPKAKVIKEREKKLGALVSQKDKCFYDKANRHLTACDFEKIKKLRNKLIAHKERDPFLEAISGASNSQNTEEIVTDINEITCAINLILNEIKDCMDLVADHHDLGEHGFSQVNPDWKSLLDCIYVADHVRNEGQKKDWGGSIDLWQFSPAQWPKTKQAIIDEAETSKDQILNAKNPEN